MIVEFNDDPRPRVAAECFRQQGRNHRKSTHQVMDTELVYGFRLDIRLNECEWI